MNKNLVAITDCDHDCLLYTSPCGATEIMEVIGKEESIARIEKAIDKLSESL